MTLIPTQIMLFVISYFFLSVMMITTLVAAADDAVMSNFLQSLKPTPPGWSQTTPFCQWEGIQCDSSNRVTSISLASKSLTGTLPSDLNSLSQLRSLSLQDNALSGPLPSLAQLSFLQTAYLNHNNFSAVPFAAFAALNSLQTLSLASNPSLSPWTFPTDLTSSTNLIDLDLGTVSLSGALPDIFDKFPSLKNLRLSYNNLTGSLPSSLAISPIALLWLNNQATGLSGTLSVLSNMTQLSQAWLHKNQFTGSIPDLSQCKGLFDLQLRDNRLTGVVPISLMTLSSLKNVSLDNNELQGPVPAFGKGVKVTLDGINSFCLDTPGDCDPGVMVLLQIAEAFGYPIQLANAWQGNDPCNGWNFIVCSTGKIVTVNFAKQGFWGTISPAFSQLTDLCSLFLNGNNLIGSIPESLTSLPQLQTLDVSDNNLSGEIPKFPSKVKLVTTGNARLGKALSPGGGASGSTPSGSPPSGSGPESAKGSASLSPGWIGGIVVIVLFFTAVVLFLSWKCYAKRQRRKFRRVNGHENGKGSFKIESINVYNGYGGVPSELQSQSSGDRCDVLAAFEGRNGSISIQVLLQVTNNFSEENILGRGGFGVVYKGELHDGTKIAVKRMESVAMGNKGLNEFQAEITVLSKVRHRHLVALLGYCINGNERLLVYEYMPQGTLTQHLFEWQEHGYAPLTWKQRVTIALDVARGVEYLHSLAQQSFIHRDLKPSNILLGHDMRAKVADFGLVKNAPDGKYSVETRLAGTFGYLAPEYAATGRVTTKVDVYAFGVVLMELVTGRKALDDTVPDERSHLVTWFRRVLINKENIPKAIDQILNPDEETTESIYKVAELAGHCTAREPYQRPDMGHAVNVLVPLVEQWKPISHEEEDSASGHFQMSLPQALRRWQADEGTSSIFNDVSISQTQLSIPSKPVGFADSFDSLDCR
ncbi:receptor-like kinase TMK4 isoform X1 [Vigna radiata var. radiata]|uniref:non-specific serine/threonine protein kinase n=1 Tax=Vigna radiata var. radiata TaxID=3916 RepID=A0A1S3TF35_VIGRR|nr:receptor-like kinase TMK4 isoform X1 [Vigna radiata var. radiata]